jgi:hypothetical protein
MKRHPNVVSLAVVLAVAAALIALAWSAPARAEKVSASDMIPTRDVDLAICLDTSNSMDGLIHAARQKLWAIVNELAQVRPQPRLRVALYQYGTPSLGKGTGYVKQLIPLSDDLDAIYAQLMELNTSGGQEYVARVVAAASNELKWSTRPDALRMIVVAGNEPATQDPDLQLKTTCLLTSEKGILINTIFCGHEQAGRSTGWADAARWGQGRYAAIDQDRGTVTIPTPYDPQLIELNVQLNATYVGYGQAGAQRKELQSRMDAKASEASPAVAAQRVAAKGQSKLYRNAEWDLVDGVEEGKVDLAEAKPEDLPESMRNMTPEQREQHVKALAEKRAAIQKQIQDLQAKRDAFRKKEIERQGLDESASFDANLRKAIRAQAADKGMTFPDEDNAPSK